MDPITAIGLAAAIVNFIDFAHKIVTGADELYKNATTEENKHTENIVNDLDDAATDLTNLPGKTKHEKALNSPPAVMEFPGFTASNSFSITSGESNSFHHESSRVRCLCQRISRLTGLE
ncbi:hypothetical protein V492_00356 [Pseudogymnoascus sp. VKM F-4246]|nr:hypothetical protein V492_00356 [Pseudogymnoascus sp. VKM F-4246]